MRLTVAPLAVLCLLFGVFPEPVLNSLVSVYSQVAGVSEVPIIRTFSFNLAFALIVVVALLFGGVRLLGGQKVRKGETWGCGIITDATMEYTAASFSQPIRRVYGPLLRPVREIKIVYDFMPYFNFRIYFEEHVQSLIRNYFYSPIRRGIVRASKKFRVIQSGNITLYLGYIFVTLILVLVWGR